MKKVLSLLLALVMCLSLCACDDGTGTSAPSKNDTKKYGTVFLYQHDKWDLYKATQISETTIKIENWGRFDAAVDGDPFKFEYDLCVISTADATTDFKWLDDSHSAFSITLYDEENSYWEEACVVTFVIATSEQ